ncbi:hypothetical protein FHS61_001575 [Altererythrobacter atlanticus]|uniref:Uncharacterized protein n=1 Tax=Croceibacterium atlanticum TaxID=1267766 RepID=A0A0F7KZJ1_9SPHN|nr:hypothetical protein [Croceibacterium atlanticum]AKH44255.1 hypothetical protein WYH_03236 [Croceibacterium atlanticum]MBB5732566.1 hypothetical protein [Croceibacterium atlanticum]
MEHIDAHGAGASARRRQMQMRTMLGIALGAFLVGGIATYYLFGPDDISPGTLFAVRQESADQPAQKTATPEPGPAPTATQTGGGTQLITAERVERVAEQQGGIDQRVAALEQRIARLDLQAQAAAGNAARAEGLLIAFATRRAIERGAPLGYLADQLRLRFGDAHPNSVRTVIATARNPITLDQLIARLDGLSPVLSEAPSNEDTFDWLTRELGELFVVRSEDTPSPAADRRLERARLFLRSGRPESAVAEVRHLPNAAAASGWIADAERYAAAQRALELLETTAILEPRELRDGSGNRVEQPSPAVSGSE